MKPYFLIVLFFFLLATGCASNAPQIAVEEIRPQTTIIEEAIKPAIDLNAYIREKLLAQYQQWKGTPYKYDGLSNKGIDCSGFMYLTFKSQFGIDMPRSTDLQVQMGDPVARSELRIGDLVFFKTGSRNRHVGVYLGDEKFMHASTSDGVRISSLNNHYWKKTYWTSKRIFG